MFDIRTRTNESPWQQQNNRKQFHRWKNFLKPICKNQKKNLIIVFFFVVTFHINFNVVETDCARIKAYHGSISVREVELKWFVKTNLKELLKKMFVFL